MSQKERIYLSSPHMSEEGYEKEYIGYYCRMASWQNVENEI
jgi:hypothetical protein